MQFIARCSAIGQIMTNPRSKKDKEAGILSQTSKTYVETWVKENYFDRKKEFSNKYTDKGISVEDESINFLVDNGILDFAIKNERFFKNDFITGTPDIIQPDKIIDVKNSWDLFTFPIFETEQTNKNYFYQLQGYMALTGKTHAQLIYMLTNTPEHIIERELHFATYKNENITKSEYEAIERKIRKNHIFDDIAPKNRIKIFDIERDDNVIKEIYARVGQCQNYVNELIKKIK